MIEGTIHLKPKEERRLLQGHLWVFSNEIARVDGEAGQGGLVEVRAAGGQLLGTATWNRRSLIAGRLLSRQTIRDLGAFVRERVVRANAQRHALGFAGAWRVVFGESDGLPGIVVDRYGNACVVESFSAGGDRMVEAVVAALVEDCGAHTVVERSASIWRTYEGLEMQQRTWCGNPAPADVEIEGIHYRIDITEGQKTGFFLDQRENRSFVESIARGKSVLDLFCNDGGFALHAARGGASDVTAVDISASAVDRARYNASRNNAEAVKVETSDVFVFIEDMIRKGRKADLVVVDPPSFVKNRKSVASGLKGYRKLNEAALMLVREGGMIVTCSCSQHVSEEMFVEMLRGAAGRVGRQLAIVRISGAAADHPVLLAMPETRYLCCVAAFVRAM